MKWAILYRNESDCNAVKKCNSEFLYQIQIALLLALKEKGRLNEGQFSGASNRLEAIRGKGKCGIS